MRLGLGLGPDKLYFFFHPLFYSLILEKCAYYFHKKSDYSLIFPQKCVITKLRRRNKHNTQLIQLNISCYLAELN